ncbi:MAG TPA: hypothetical protein VLB29_16980 [Nocardioidaceae bacterium]|nr:hypothetical protein [Nocardioidaceae bacterium]
MVPSRYCGPSSSGNGGYTAGLLAERFAKHPHPRPECPVVEVTLRKPPPLETDLTVEHVDEGPATRLLHDGTLVAEARCTDEELAAVDEVTPEEAAEAMAGYAGLRTHPFPRCFACGPERAAGDGLRIFPGPVGRGRVASAWTPHASLAEASDLLDPGVQRVSLGTTWAALDCVGGWSTDLEGRPAVLGQIAARVDALPVVGEPHVVMGAELAVEGRKTFTASTVYDSDGRIVARARHIWIAVDPSAFT